MNRVTLLQFIICFMLVLLSSYLMGQKLSDRIANYEMDITLDTESKMIVGSTKLIWLNPSDNPVEDLQFHLYYNAFKNSQSTFMQEGTMTGLMGNALNEECRWGYSEITAMRDKSGSDLLQNARYIAPNDGNIHDETVLEVKLTKGVLPGESIEITFDWEARIPKTMVRTGYNKDFYFFAQWFPKVGVYEPTGMRYAEEDGWNCHQYFASGEYYGEFGNYDVTLHTPENFIVAATGEKIDETIEGSIKTIRFQQNDVIDFTWTASPHFIRYEDHWKNVLLELYAYPGHEKFVERYFTVLKQAMEYMDSHVGTYPYATLTMIDPPIHGLFTGGMEYPTLITSLCLSFLPKGVKAPETLVVHEFVHQYFMQMIATHEQEEPWMDEGITTYYEGRILDHYYGNKSSLSSAFDINIGNGEYNRLEFLLSGNSEIGDNSLRARDFKYGGYGSIAYNKTAMMMKTLEGIIGSQKMDEIMRSYFSKWKFKHPSGIDFINHFKKELNEEFLESLKLDLDLFFEQVLYGSFECDFEIRSIKNIGTSVNRGFLENNTDCVVSEGVYKGYQFDSEVVIHRSGEVILPVDVLIQFEDGSETIFSWDGQSRATSFSNKGDIRIINAKVDPYNKINLDKNRINNTLLVEESKSYKKYGVRLKMALQHLFDLISYIS